MCGGHSIDHINSLVIELLEGSLDNPKALADFASYLDRTEFKLRQWCSNGKAELFGDTLFYALGLLEKTGKISRLSKPETSDVASALTIAFARKQLSAKDVAHDLTKTSPCSIRRWAMGGSMMNTTKFRLLWSLSKRKLIDWTWIKEKPDHIQRVIAFLAVNPTATIDILVGNLGAEAIGASALKSVFENPDKFVNEQVVEALKAHVPIPSFIPSQPLAKPGVAKVQMEPWPKVEKSIEAHGDSKVVSLLESMDLESRILSTAEVLFADLRMLFQSVKSTNLDALLAALDEIRQADKRHVMFNLENLLAVFNTGEKTRISRWIKEELR